VTYLPQSSEAKAKNVEKIAFLADIVVNLSNDITDFYFEDKTKVKGVIAFFDPSMPSLNCINVLDLPQSFNVKSFGPMMINNDHGYKGTGLTIYGNKFKKKMFFHLTSHNFETTFHFYRNQESIFNSKLVK
jgi:hypothetical protein